MNTQASAATNCQSSHHRVSVAAESRPGWRPALSPSRAADFKQCPLLFRLKAIDRIEEPHTEAQVRGLVVHGVLERLFVLPPHERTPTAAEGFVDASVEGLVASRPDTADTARSDDVRAKVVKLLGAYFDIEDPTRLASVEVEQRVEAVTEDGVPLRGFIDRLDIAPNGAIRTNDYKSGSAPSEAWEQKALFQLKLYALAVWWTRGVVPSVLRLLYLTGPKWLEVTTSEDELRRFSRSLTAMWRAIEKAGVTGDFRPSPSYACRWCSFHALCPAKGGTPPPYPGWPDEQVAS